MSYVTLRESRYAFEVTYIYRKTNHQCRCLNPTYGLRPGREKLKLNTISYTWSKANKSLFFEKAGYSPQDGTIKQASI